MAPLPIIDNCVRVAWNWVAGDARSPFATNVMHFKYESEPYDVIDALQVAMEPNGQDMFDSCSESVEIDNITVTPLDGHSATILHTVTSWDGRNGRGNTDFIPQVCVLVKLNTAIRGRSGRGRVYLPGVAENKTLRGQLDLTSVDIMQEGWQAYGLAMTLQGYIPAVASYKEEEVHGATFVTVETSTATQRRRQKR